MEIMVKVATRKADVVVGAVVKLTYPKYLQRESQFLKVDRVKRVKVSGEKFGKLEEELGMDLSSDTLIAWCTPTDEPTDSWRCPLVSEFE
jgi:hypothetical protein